MRSRTICAVPITAVTLVIVTACSGGSTPPLPSIPAPPSVAPAAATTPPPLKGCSDNNKTRVQSFAPNGTLAALGVDSATVKKIRQRGRLIAGVSADNLLFGYRNPLTGNLEGFDINMARAVAASIFGTAAGHIEYVVEDFAQRIPDLQSGRVDIVADIMTINCSRWRQIDFSTEYYHAGQQVLVRKDARFNDINQMNGRKVCVAADSTGSQDVKRFPRVKAIHVPDISDCMVLFQEGSIDGILSDDTVVRGFADQDPYVKILPRKLTNEPYGLGMSKQDPTFARYVNALLAQMRSDGTWASIYRKWLGSPPKPPSAVYGRSET
jgi:polar amino acid transport system substrate-binding protein